MREMGRVAIAGVHLEEEKEGPLGNRLPGVRPYAAFRPSVPKSAAGCQSACGLLGGRETKKLFGRRIWRATDECLAARSLTAAATATDGDATANDRRGKGEGEEKRRGDSRERASERLFPVRRTAGRNISGRGWILREGCTMPLFSRHVIWLVKIQTQKEQNI